MAKRAQKAESAKVASIRHKDKRPNIPTEELRDFVAQDEEAPSSAMSSSTAMATSSSPPPATNC